MDSMTRFSVDLQFQAARVQPRLAQNLFDALDERVARELPAGDVDVHRQAGRRRVARLPLLHPARGLGEHPVADRRDQPQLFGDGDELVGRDQPALRVLPTHQRRAPRSRR
jgi:hypothetical protein